MRDHCQLFGDAAIAIVTFSDPKRLAAYRVHLGVDFAILSDPDRALYRLLGAERGSNRQVWSPGTLLMYARLFRKGRRLTRTNEDIHQLGADVVIGRNGRIRYLHLPASPDARPPVSDLVAALD